eukprot:c4914_g1_i1.p1 GENE.c4914_g1_i1~~c4914_g1_i1.p1  ORF type:complete len:338 (+),score=79.95 c4914_g1_i1:26-1015(+)
MLSLITAILSTTTPIIGVLSVPLENSDCITALKDANFDAQVSPTSCFHSVYVKWLESSGARVVPIRYDSSQKQLDDIFDSVNGVLFTGGETVITNLGSQYMQTAGYLLNKTVEANVRGDYVPLWGTCMGLQTLSILAAQNASVLTTSAFDSEDIMLPLNFTADAPQSRMFGGLPFTEYQWLEVESLTTNMHHDGVQPSVFHANAQLDGFFSILATNMDRKGLEFVSAMEGKKFPVYAVQFHPERPQFEWIVNNDFINHDAHAIETMQSLGNFFVSEARRNNHAFSSADAEANALIYNYRPTGSSSYQAYVFSPLPTTPLSFRVPAPRSQ